MTNLEMIRQKSIEYFAEIGVISHEEPDYDEGMNGEWEQIGTSVYYSSAYFDHDFFWDYNDAYECNLRWLSSETTEDDTDYGL